MFGLALGMAASAAPVKIAAVTAKSSYETGEVSYPVDRVRDGRASTAWFEGDPGSGVGSWIELDLGGPHTVTRLQLLAGDWSSGADWARANRPREVEVRWSDDTTTLWTLTDTQSLQTFVPSAPKSTDRIRLKVNAIHGGTAFPDTAISEVLVWDDQPDPNVAVRTVTASTEFPADADGSYVAAHLTDGVRDTSWCEGNAASDGVGEWVEVGLEAPTRISGLLVCNGLCASAETLKQGNAASRVTLGFSDGSSQTVELKALMPLPQKVAVTPVTTASVRMRIDAVRRGTTFDDTCLSEVTFVR